MSIENEIKKLTEAVNLLTSSIAGMNSNQLQLDVSEPQESKKTEEVVEETAKETTSIAHDDVKRLILKLNRADKENKPKLKALLEKFDATKVADLSKDDLPKVMKQLEDGDF